MTKPPHYVTYWRGPQPFAAWVNDKKLQELKTDPKITIRQIVLAERKK